MTPRSSWRRRTTSSRLPPNLKFIGTVNVDETTHGFADKVYDRSQLIELTIDRDGRPAPPRRPALRAAPRRGLGDLRTSRTVRVPRPRRDQDLRRAKPRRSGVRWQTALDEQLLQKVLPKIKGTDLALGAALYTLRRACADRFPLSHAKADDDASMTSTSMASPPTSRLRFLDDAAGTRTHGPREWRRSSCRGRIPAEPPRTDTASSERRATPRFSLSPIDGELRVLAEWPLSGTGRYRLRLEPRGRRRGSARSIVTPEKISARPTDGLIDDLQTTLPASIAIGLQRAGALTGLQLRPLERPRSPKNSIGCAERSVGRRPVRARRRSLTAIARDPHRVLRKTEQWVERERVRRLEPVGLVAPSGCLTTSTRQYALPSSSPGCSSRAHRRRLREPTSAGLPRPGRESRLRRLAALSHSRPEQR